MSLTVSSETVGSKPPATYAGVTNRVQHLNAVGLDAAFVDLIDHPTTFPKVWGILGWNIFLHNTHLMLTPPEPREGPRGPGGWHQDNGRRTLDMPEIEIPARLSLKVGYFLTDVAKPDMGNFWVVPGSHRRRSVGVKPGGGGLVPGAEPVLLRAGDALIFDARVWHSGSPNYSDITRKVLFFAYAYRWLHSDNVLPPGHDARKITDPIRRQLLDIIDNRWRAHGDHRRDRAAAGVAHGNISRSLPRGMNTREGLHDRTLSR